MKTDIESILPSELVASILRREEVENTGELRSILVPPEKIHQLASSLKSNGKCDFRHLSLLTCVDFKEYFEVVYILYTQNIGTKAPDGPSEELIVRTHVPREKPALPSITDIYPTANWQEREAWDMMGIEFEGHPDLRRVLMPDDWIGFPQRKDYVKRHWKGYTDVLRKRLQEAVIRKEDQSTIDRIKWELQLEDRVGYDWQTEESPDNGTN
jgi:NADH-quinone oxidoreductase subunit C